MKKIISLIAVVAMLVTMCSFTAFAQNTRTITLSATAEKANVGDNVEFLATLSTSNAVKAAGIRIAFDPNDFELGLSDSANENSATFEEYKSFVGTPDFPTEESVWEALIGHKSYVSDTYFNTYAGYAANKNLGTATIDYEEKDGLGRVSFGYAISTAKNALNKIDNMLVGGAVLKVKTTEAKQAVVKLIETDTTDGTNTKYVSVVNEVVINLNGFGEVVEPEVPTAKDYGLFTDAKQNFKVTTPVMTSNKYAIEKALGFVSGINNDVELKCGTEITCEGSDKVLDIPAENFYAATDVVKGFVAAVTSIRDTNLDKEFSARAYVIVDGEKVYAEEIATAVYGK